MPGKIDINLQATANTSTIDEDIKPFGDQNAPHILNTGVLQDGGITNLYEQEEIYAQAGEYYITDDNEVLSAIVDPNDANKVVISLEGKPLGSVSAYGVRARHKIQNVDDVVITEDDSYLTCKLSGGSIIITEYDLYTGAQKNTRTTTWVNLATIGGFYTTLSFVRYEGLSFSDSLEFLLRLGDGAVRLQESDLAVFIYNNNYQTTQRLAGSAYYLVASVVYQGTLVVVTNNGYVSSFDGKSWKFWDGTGNGSGIYNQIGITYAAIVYDGSVVFTISGGGIVSYKNGWRYANGTGTGSGIWNDGTHSGTNISYSCGLLTVAGVEYIVFGSAGGRISSYSTTWHSYTSGTGISNNATALGANDVTAIGLYGTTKLVFGAANGRVANYTAGSGWTNFDGTGAGIQPYSNAAVIGANAVRTIVDTPWGLAIAGGTRCGSYSIAGWKDYLGAGAGTGPYKNTWGSGLSVDANGGYYVNLGVGKQWLVLVGLGDLESFDGVAWSDGAGTGPRINSDARYQLRTLTVYNSSIALVGNGVYMMSGTDGKTLAPIYSPFPYLYQLVTPVVYQGKLHATTIGGALYRLDNVWTQLTAQMFSTASAATCSIVYGNYLVLTNATGDVSSWDGANLKRDDGAGTGTGPFNDGTAMGSSAIRAACEFNGNLVIAGASGRLASWSGAAWRNYNSGTQISNNATVLGAVSIEWLHVYNTFLVVAGANGRVGSYDLTNWKNYDGTGTGTGPFNNATAVGNFTIICGVIYNFTLILSTASGTVGSWDGATWYNYNGTSGIRDNQGLSSSVTLVYVIDNYLYEISQGQRRYTTGTNWSTVLSGGHILTANGYGVCNFQNGVIGYGSYITNTTYYDFAIQTPSIPIFWGIQSVLTPYVYKQTFGGVTYYLVVFSASEQSIGVFIDFANLRCYYANIQYAVKAYNTGGGVYHYIVGTPQYWLTSFETYGRVGEISTTDFRQFVTYPTFGSQVGTLLQWASGYGYSEAIYKILTSSANIYNRYAPAYAKDQASVIATGQTQTNTRIDGYGKLINNGGTAPTTPLELRCGIINAEPSFISAAQYGTSSDCVGVLLTNVGEFDPTYGPQIEGDKNILYKSGAAFIICALDSTVSQRFERINEHLYKINTISPSNLYDTLGGRFHVASSDYNGRMLITSTAAPAVSSTQIVGVQVGEFASSIDTGDKLITITSPTRDNYEIVGYILPDPGLVPDYAVDVYIADVYYASSRSDGTELVDPTKSGTLYLTTSSLPVAIGYPYNNGSLATLTSTVLLVDNYDGYEIGNELAGQYVAFQLFGQLYLFDGYNIYLATVQGGLIVAKTITAPAQGLRFIAISPTEAIFCSDFDNSLHVFNGGRTLQKSLFFNRLDPILSGSWSVRDNSLLLDTASTFIFVRDSRITTLAKAADQSGLRIYTTTDGLVVGNNTGNWRYLYKALGTVLPLAWQSAYFGLDTNNLAYVQNAVLVIQSPTRARLQVVANIQTFDEDTYYRNESAFDILPSMYNDKNVVRVRVQPPTQRGLAVSVGAEIDGKAVLAQATIDFTEDTTAGISAKATR